MRNHVSGVLPKALESRMAISGLIPDFPVTILFKVCRVTPRTFAPLVTDKPKGSRQSCRTMSPGCGGFFIGMDCRSFSSVVVDEFNVERIGALKAENDSPAGPHSDGPESLQ